MSICKLFTLTFLFSFISHIIEAQDNYKILSIQDSISNYLKTIKNVENDSNKIYYSNKVNQLFHEILILPESFDFNFDSLKTVGKEMSPDQIFRVITWNIPLKDGTYRYFGFIQLKEKETIKLFDLTDRAEEVAAPENSVLSKNKWYGALYYKILKNKVDQYTYYTLLGLRFNDIFTTTKIIEILYFDQFQNPVFGAPVFNLANKLQHRMLFHFSARVSMNLKYDDKLKMIVYDHLSPSESKYTGQFMYYGPDFSYDGFVFKDKKWQYKTNLDLKRTEPTQPKTPKRSDKLH